MSDLLSRPERRLDAPFPASRRKRSWPRFFKPGFVVLLGFVIVLALGSGALLLFTDLPWPVLHLLAHAPASAVPLLCIGLASLGFQFVVRPKCLDLLKALIVSAAFLFWGIDQLLPTGGIATALVVFSRSANHLATGATAALSSRSWTDNAFCVYAQTVSFAPFGENAPGASAIGTACLTL